MKRCVIILSVFLVGAVTGFFLCRSNLFRGATKMLSQVDTVTVYDTIRLESPAEIRSEIVTDTLILRIRDTIRVSDTLYLVENRQVKEYSDSLYFARVSGIRPSLDYIEVYPKTTYITKTESVLQKPSPWGFSLGCGLDYGRMGQDYLTGNIGAEIAYKRLALGVEGGLNIDIYNGAFSAPQLYWQVGVRYTILGK